MQAYTVCAFLNSTDKCNCAFLSWISLENIVLFSPLVNPFRTSEANCTNSEACCSQCAGQGLMLLKTNKAWGACGEQRGSVFKGRSEPTSAFVWEKECQECGLFQETSMHLSPLGQIIAIPAAQDGWWGISISWTCLWVMVTCQSTDNPLRTSIYARLCIQPQDVSTSI